MSASPIATHETANKLRDEKVTELRSQIAREQSRAHALMNRAAEEAGQGDWDSLRELSEVESKERIRGKVLLHRPDNCYTPLTPRDYVTFRLLPCPLGDVENDT